MNKARTQARMRARTSPHAGLHPARQSMPRSGRDLLETRSPSVVVAETVSVSSPHGDRQKHAGWLVFAEVGSCRSTASVVFSAIRDRGLTTLAGAVL